MPQKRTPAIQHARISLKDMRTSHGNTVLDLSKKGPVLLVFLRRFGCTFCREAMQDLSDLQAAIARRGATLVMVHMSAPDVAEAQFSGYGLEKIAHVSDQPCTFYRAFGLTKGTARQLFGLHTWIRGFQAGLVDGHGAGYQQLADGFQMPGVFVVDNGQLRGKFVHKYTSDRPDYLALLDQGYTR